MRGFKSIVLASLCLCFIIFLASLFTITQGESALMLRLGRLVTDKNSDAPRILHPGLHYKWPFIEQVRVFDTRLQTLDIKSSRIVTREKKDVIVDYLVKWRIEDLGRYFRATSGNQLKAETLLEQQLNTSLRAEFGKRTISELVTGGRDDVMDELRNQAEKQASLLGIHVEDVRIKGIELPATTSNTIYQRMRADMKKIANRHRADGQAAAEVIQATADAKVTVALAQAQSEGQSIRAQGQAKASQIYANAYTKDTAFFAFYQSLKAYETSFNTKQDLLILDPKSSFFNYFQHSLMPDGGVARKKTV